MRKLTFALAALVIVSTPVISLAETPDRQEPVNVGAAQATQGMTPAEKYSLLGKQSQSDKNVDPSTAYGAQPGAVPGADPSCKDKQNNK